MKQTSLAYVLATAESNCLMLDVSQTKFKELQPALTKLIKEWILERIVSFKVNPKNGCLFIISRDDEKYHVHRFFILGDRWSVSRDVEGDAEDVINFLLGND